MQVSDYTENGDLDYQDLFLDVTDVLERLTDDKYAESDVTPRYAAYYFTWFLPPESVAVSASFMIDFGDMRFDSADSDVIGKMELQVEVEVPTAFDDNLRVPREELAQFVDNEHGGIWYEVEIDFDNRGLPFSVYYRDTLEVGFPPANGASDVDLLAHRLWNKMRQYLNDYDALAEKMAGDVY